MRALAAPAALALAAAVTLLSPRALADDDGLRDGVRSYGESRWRQGAGLALAGAGSMVGGGLALGDGSRFGGAFGTTVLAGGALELGLGAGVLLSTAGWQSGTARALSSGDASAGPSELGWVEGASARRRVTEVAEATVLTGGLLTSYFGSSSDAARGVGLGLAIDAAVLLAADVIGGMRADGYAAALRSAGFAVSPDGRTALVTVTRGF